MGLKLIANDAGDLEILSSAMQDAILRVGDIRYDATARALNLRATRYRHETKKSERIETGMRVDSVLSVKSQGIDRQNPDAFLVLLNMTFESTDAPSGLLTFQFAGAGELVVEIEGLDILLADIGETRKTRAQPRHES